MAMETKISAALWVNVAEERLSVLPFISHDAFADEQGFICELYQFHCHNQNTGSHKQYWTISA